MKACAVITALVTATLLAGHADAGSVSKQYETDKTLGVGIALGVPFGLTGKYLVTPKVGLDFGIGGYYLYRDRGGIHVHGDLLWHPFVAVEGESYLAPLYLGLGLRLLNYDDFTHFGLRIPVGVAFDFNQSPIEVFLESAFVYDVSMSEGAEGAYDFNGLVGLRYYF